MSRAHYARSAQVVGTTARTTNRSCAHARLVARTVEHSCAGPVTTQSPGRDNPGCDLKQADPGCNLKAGSRLHFPYQALGQVATSLPGRDLLVDQARSRRQPHVATSLPAQQRQTRSRLQNGVATSNPTGQITTSNFQVATPKGHPTSRPHIHVTTSFPPNQNKRGLDLKTRSRHQIHNVLLRCQNPRSLSLRPTVTQPGRNATPWSRPHVQPNQVATSNGYRNLK